MVLKPSIASFFSRIASAFFIDGVGALERRRVGQLRVDHDVALVLLRHEAAGNVPDQHDDHVDQHADERQAPEHLPDQDARRS